MSNWIVKIKKHKNKILQFGEKYRKYVVLDNNLMIDLNSCKILKNDVFVLEKKSHVSLKRGQILPNVPKCKVPIDL